MEDDTIVAVASARGQSALGIVRLSGARSLEAASACLAAPIAAGTYTRREGSFLLPETAPFPVAVYVMRAPRSYTREDVVEIHAPGTPALLAAISSELCRHGARPAEAGEFTRRAFLNGRIDLAQAEAVLAVIRARSEDEERLALSALGGNLSEEVTGIRSGLMSLVVELEAGMDFSEEERDAVEPARRREAVERALGAIVTLVETSVTRQVFREEVVAVLFGAANAGKSSLFNLLSGGAHAITHETPGTTRDFLEAKVAIGGATFLLIDTAGVRAPREVVEAMAVERSRRFAREAQLVLFVVDASEEVTPEVEALYEEARRLPHIVVLNKSDRSMAINGREWRRRFCGAQVLEVSAATGQGQGELEAALAEYVEGGKVDLSTMRFHLAGRQRRLLEEARLSLERASAVIDDAPDEILSLELREAVESLGRITGEDYVEDLLDEVFSRFCLGK